MAAHTRCKNTGKNAVDLRFANGREFLGAFVSKKLYLCRLKVVSFILKKKGAQR